MRRVECKEIEKQELLKQALEHASDRGINASMLVYCQHQFTEALGDLQERVARTYELASAEAQVSLGPTPDVDRCQALKVSNAALETRLESMQAEQQETLRAEEQRYQTQR